MRVKSIKYVGKADVYNLEVDQTHDFAVENGVIVHNCADESRYFCMARPVAPRIIVPPKAKIYNPLETEKPVMGGLGFIRTY